MRGLGPLILRLALGALFIAHGLPKLVPVWGLRPADTEALLQAAGVTAAYSVTVGIGLAELLAGALLVVGAYTPLATLLLSATTTASSWVLHLSNGFFLNWLLETGVGHGYEFDFLRLAALVCLMISGPGALAVDTHRSRVKQQRKRTSPVVGKK